MKKINKTLLLLLFFNYLYPQTLQKELPSHEPIDIVEKLGSTIALDSEFLNENGEKVILQDLFSKDIPTIITLNYFECPMLCSLVLNGLGDALKNLSLNAGSEYQVITIDINPHESYQLANQKKNN